MQARSADSAREKSAGYRYPINLLVLWIAHPLSVTEIHNRNLIGYFEQISQSDFKDLFLLLTTDVQSAIIVSMIIGRDTSKRMRVRYMNVRVTYNLLLIAVQKILY